MNLERLQAALPPGFILQHNSITNSTNTDATDWLAQGYGSQALFIADQQRAGRGRREREWVSPVGNIYASLVIPRPNNLRTIGHHGFQLSLAIHNAIKQHAPLAPVQVKWPNDVLLDKKKCAGILIEIAGNGLILGFGVNLVPIDIDAPYPVACLQDCFGVQSPTEFCAEILEQFFALQAFPPDAILSRWKQAAIGLGQTIIVNLPDRQLTGVFRDIAADGALLLDMSDETKSIYAGDIFFG